MTPRSWAVASLVTGLLLVHFAWILSVPPYRGIDEFDHVYKAASVAHGQVRPYDEPVRYGRGDYLRVPAKTVDDAGPVCETYDYVGRDNCSAAEDLDSGYVKVASAAADYNPAYYAFVGTLARPWAGAEFVYVARVVTALAVVALWGLAAVAAARARQPRVALLALGLVATPVLTYSGSVVAPNGLEMASAAALWMSLLVIGEQDSRTSERLLLLIAAGSACILATVRTLGPFWLVLIVSTVLLLPGRTRRVTAIRHHQKLTLTAIGAAGASTVLSAWWVMSAGTNQVQQDGDTFFGEPWHTTLIQLPLWVFQSIAAFPTRSEQAPTIVYGLVLATMTLVFLAFAARSGRRWWFTLAAMSVVWLVPPFVFTLLTYELAGTIWQGRYSLPYSIGIVLVLLVVMSSEANRLPLRALTTVAATAYALAVMVSVGNVRQREINDSPLSGDDRWLTLPLWATLLLAGVGTVLVFGAAMSIDRRSRSLRAHDPSERLARATA